jgi:hypothetical protein
MPAEEIMQNKVYPVRKTEISFFLFCVPYVESFISQEDSPKRKEKERKFKFFLPYTDTDITVLSG